MNREIKFRGKCVPDSKYAGEWVTGGYVAPESDCRKQDEGLIISYYGGNTQCAFHVIPDTVGQFIGLNDKEDNEIFEGDIVEVTCLDISQFGRKMLCSIVYDEGCACFSFRELYRIRCICSTLPDAEFEVIGNIHENQELMKEVGRNADEG